MCIHVASPERGLLHPTGVIVVIIMLPTSHQIGFAQPLRFGAEGDLSFPTTEDSLLSTFLYTSEQI